MSVMKKVQCFIPWGSIHFNSYYYFKIYKPKKEEEDDQPEGLETGDLETVEDDEELDDEPEDFEDSEK